jgi:hypothetical protein
MGFKLIHAPLSLFLIPSYIKLNFYLMLDSPVSRWVHASGESRALPCKWLGRHSRSF